MNLETRLNDSLNDILRSSGYIFEIINKNKRQSNLVTGSNNQLIPPVVTAQLGNSIGQFDDILDDTVSKFNDAKWCVEQMLESRQKQEEMKLKEEERKKEEEERKKLEEKRRMEEEKKRVEEKKIQEERKREEEKRKQEEEQRKQEEKKKQEEERERQERQKAQQQQPSQPQAQGNDQDLFGDFISPGFDFNINEVMDKSAADNGNNANGNSNDIPNPSDILSSIDYPDLNAFGNNNTNNNDNNGNNNVNGGSSKGNNNGISNNGTAGDQMNDSGVNDNMNNNNGGAESNAPDGNNLDLDINNVLGNNDLILDGLNMSLLDQEDELNTQTNNNDDFDVDNFLNQFAGND